MVHHYSCLRSRFIILYQTGNEQAFYNEHYYHLLFMQTASTNLAMHKGTLAFVPFALFTCSDIIITRFRKMRKEDFPRDSSTPTNLLQTKYVQSYIGQSLKGFANCVLL